MRVIDIIVLFGFNSFLIFVIILIIYFFFDELLNGDLLEGVWGVILGIMMLIAVLLLIFLIITITFPCIREMIMNWLRSEV